MGGAVGVENAAAADLQEDEHVESPKQHRVDGEEVAGQDRSGVSGEKLRPRRTIAARCRRNAMTAQDAADGGRRDLVAEIGGPPRRGRKPKAAQCLRTSSLCQRSNVAGEKSKRPGGNLEPSAARIIRSAGSSSGRVTCRCRTATWWQRARISRSRS